MANDCLCNVVILDEVDADRLLRALYNGTRPRHVHTLICLCGAIADLRTDPKAWNGWQILPHAKCPACRHTVVERDEELYPTQARARFLLKIDAIQEGMKDVK
jgi:2-keto-3-deoxy-galactonokinase